MCRAFLRLVGSGRVAVIVNVNTWGMVATMPVGTSYFISKLALGRLSEAIPLAYPKVSSMNYHPGMIYTDMAERHPETLPFCGDTGMLIVQQSLRLGFLHQIQQ
jgi:NAD(P)-dependent dehydrogenase (short-subunit alcohol dehydrogenase family)